MSGQDTGGVSVQRNAPSKAAMIEHTRRALAARDDFVAQEESSRDSIVHPLSDALTPSPSTPPLSSSGSSANLTQQSQSNGLIQGFRDILKKKSSSPPSSDGKIAVPKDSKKRPSTARDQPQASLSSLSVTGSSSAASSKTTSSSSSSASVLASLGDVVLRPDPNEGLSEEEAKRKKRNRSRSAMNKGGSGSKSARRGSKKTQDDDDSDTEPSRPHSSSHSSSSSSGAAVGVGSSLKLPSIMVDDENRKTSPLSPRSNESRNALSGPVSMRRPAHLVESPRRRSSVTVLSPPVPDVSTSPRGSMNSPSHDSLCLSDFSFDISEIDSDSDDLLEELDESLFSRFLPPPSLDDSSSSSSSSSSSAAPSDSGEPLLRPNLRQIFRKSGMENRLSLQVASAINGTLGANMSFIAKTSSANVAEQVENFVWKQTMTQLPVDVIASFRGRLNDDGLQAQQHQQQQRKQDFITLYESGSLLKTLYQRIDNDILTGSSSSSSSSSNPFSLSEGNTSMLSSRTSKKSPGSHSKVNTPQENGEDNQPSSSQHTPATLTPIMSPRLPLSLSSPLPSGTLQPSSSSLVSPHSEVTVSRLHLSALESSAALRFEEPLTPGHRLTPKRPASNDSINGSTSARGRSDDDDDDYVTETDNEDEDCDIPSNMEAEMEVWQEQKRTRQSIYFSRLFEKGESVISVVNGITYSNPIKVSPRKSKAVITFFDSNGLSFLDYAMTHFDLGKKSAKYKTGSSRYRAKIKKLCLPSKSVIQSGLHAFRSAELQAEAIEVFKHILAYTNEKTTNPLENAQAIIQKGLERSSLRDEIYAQLIKQTNSKDKKLKDTVSKAWELIQLVTGCFTPSPYFLKYVTHYLDECLNEPGDLGTIAIYCKDRLSKTQIYGKRSYIPVLTELQKVKERKPMMLTFFFMDKRQKQVPCYSSTTANEALEFLTAMIGLKDPAGYMVYEVFKKIHPKTKKEEVVERSLLYNEILSDSLAKFYQFEQAFNEISKGEAEAKAYFLVKRKLFLNARALSDNRVENLLMFHQISPEIASGELSADFEEICDLSGISLQLKHGDFQPGRDHDHFEFMPDHVFHQRGTAEWKEDIDRSYKELKGVDQDELRAKYLQICKQLTFYGYKMIPAKHSSTWNMPSDIYLGIAQAGVFFLSSKTKEAFYSFSYLEILTHTSSPTTLLLGFDSGDEIELLTSHGDEAISLILDYKYLEFQENKNVH